LIKLVENESQSSQNTNMITNLEHIIKVLFFSTRKLSKDSERFITMLLGKSRQFNKLGIFSLYCLALALQEQEIAINLPFF